MGWKFWQAREKPDCQIIGVIRRIENKDLHDYLQVKFESVSSRGFDIIDYCQKPNLNIEVLGGARLGKTSLGELLALKLPSRKIIFNFKRFNPARRDFDIGFSWIDITQHLPNFWDDPQSSAEAFRCAFFSEANMRGLMIDAITASFAEVMAESPKSFEEFFKILNRVARSGNWNRQIADLVEAKVRLLEKATKDAKKGSVDFSKGNIVVDLGFVPNEECKTYIAEYLIRQIARIEEEAQREERICIMIDESWHLLANASQHSKIGELLLQGAYYIQLIIITQNYTHLDEEYRGHFGTIFCFQDVNDGDISKIKNAYPDGLIWEGLGQIPNHSFIDLSYRHEKAVVPVWKLNYENLQRLKLEAKAKSALKEPDEAFQEETEEKKQQDGKENFEEKIIEILIKSEVALYGYQIAKAVGLSSKDAVKIRQPLRELLNEGKIKEIKIQVRNKEVVYYYLPDTEIAHNFMMIEVEQKMLDAGWTIILKVKHGIQGADFIIEKDGKQLIIEVETGNKKSLVGEFNKKIMGYDKPVLIVVPNIEQKERYSYLPCVQNGKARIVLIPEIEEALKN